MAVVTKATYESLSGKIGNAYAAQVGAVPYIASGLAEIVALDDADQEYDLLFAWYGSNGATGTNFSDTSKFRALASSLNSHAELRSGKTLTTFLDESNIAVSSNFAVVSKDAGWDVDDFIA